MEIIDVAKSYLDALLSHDAASVRLAPDARRIDNGAVTVEGADALRAIIRREPAAATSSFRWLVDGDQAIAFYDLDADLALARGDEPSPRDQWIPAYIGERFQIRDDLIHEIEVVYAANPGQPRPARPTRYAQAEAAREEVIGAARLYLASLVSHDASAVPLADQVWRIENGKNTGDSAEALRKSLESQIMHTVQSISDARWFVGGDTAAAFYTLHAKAGDSTLPVRIAERFRVVDGLIAEIDAIFAPIPNPDNKS
jgi:hypothetical protein